MNGEIRPDDVELQKKELEVKLEQIKLRNELATLGLQGTLMGALASCFVIVALALIGAFSPKVQITGKHLCIITGIMALAVVVYGAYIFERSLHVAAELEGKKASLGTGERTAS